MMILMMHLLIILVNINSFRTKFQELYVDYIENYDIEIVTTDNELYVRCAQQPNISVKLCSLCNLNVKKN